MADVDEGVKKSLFYVFVMVVFAKLCETLWRPFLTAEYGVRDMALTRRSRTPWTKNDVFWH